MAIFYIDLEGGSPTGTGVDFANRRNTWTGLSGAATNNEYRIMGSPDPLSVGSSQWTDNTNTVVLPAAKSMNVDLANTAWTASASVTATVQTTLNTGMWSEGTNYCRLATLGAFTTGIYAYTAFGSTQDFSAYNSLSMIFCATRAIAAGELTLNFCSDAVGAVTIMSVPIPATPTSSTGFRLYLDNVGTLPAGVNSISWGCPTDVASITFNWDNIIAVKDITSSDHISHDSLLGKNSSGDGQAWYPIKAINGTTLTIGDYLSTPATPRRGYRGPTENVTTYTQRCFKILYTSTQMGPNNGRSLITGGWDRTSMATQDRETYVTGGLFTDYMCVYGINGIGYSKKVSYSSFFNAPLPLSLSTSYGTGCEGRAAVNLRAALQNGTGNYSFNFDYWQHCDAIIASVSASLAGNSAGRVKGKRFDGCGSTDPTGTSGWPVISHPVQIEFNFDKISNCLLGAGGPASAGVAREYYYKNAVFENNVTDISTSTQMNLDNCTFSFTPALQGSGGNSVSWTRKGGDPLDNGLCNQNMIVVTQTSVVPVGETWAWRMTFGTGAWWVPGTPLNFEILQIPVITGKTYTIDWQGRREGTSVSPNLQLVDELNVENNQTLTPTVNTWQASSYSWVASADGVASLRISGEINPAVVTIGGTQQIYFGKIVVTET